MGRSISHRIAGSAFILAMALALPAQARTFNALEKRGQALLTRMCARCHAVGLTGDSPRRQAPPLRFIARRYEIADLTAQLRTGLTGPHPDMPTFTFSRDAARAVEAYLNAIQR